MTHARLFASVAFLLAAALILGAGSPPLHADSDAADNPFAGTWSGTFECTSCEDPTYGTLEWTITKSGQITGTFYNEVAEVGGTMVGHVDKFGSLHLNPNIYGPGPGGKGANGEQHAGEAYINDDGQLVGITTGTWHGGYSVTAILDPV